MHRIAAALLVLSLPATADAAVVLLSHRNEAQVLQWDSASPDTTALVHSTQCNDVDYNTAEGVTLAWVVEHHADTFGRFVVGSDVGLDALFDLEDPLVHYDYPKHVAVYNGEVVIMSHNDGTLYRYSPTGEQLGAVKTPAPIGQGMATDGTDLFVSVWNGGPSLFIRYDESFTIMETLANPTGMDALDNLFDFTFDPVSGRWFGLATTGESGTSTATKLLLEFTMGGAVLATYPLAFEADGIGRFNVAACGDSSVDFAEECDDGNLEDGDGCTAACLINVCGDGHTWLDVEDCDDANDVDTDACTTACTLASCGDGLLWTDVEACDDANDIDDDGCTNACTLPACGDGIVQAGEMCDDPDPLVCQNCVPVPPDLTTTSATTTASETGDDTTGTSTTAIDDTTTDAASTSTSTATSSTSTSTTTTTGDGDTGGDTGGATGDAPTTGYTPDPASSSSSGDPATPNNTGPGTTTDDGCGCNATSPSQAALLALLALPWLRRRRNP